MSDALDNLINDIAGRISERVESGMRFTFERLIRENKKLVYSEEEAAEFLGNVGIETLQSWRRRKLISYSRYPLAKLRRDQSDDDLGNLVTYSLEDLLTFKEKYLIPATGAAKKGKILNMRRSA